MNILSSANEQFRDLAGVAAAAVQGQGGLGQEEEEQEDEEQGARVAPHQGGCLVTTTVPSCQQCLSSLPTGAQAPLAHVSGAESLLAHREMLHFWKKIFLKLLHR